MSCTECDAATSSAGFGLAAKPSQMAGGGACWAPGLMWCFAQRPRWMVCNDDDYGVTRPALMGLRVDPTSPDGTAG
jgi:hypothetical protein